MIQEKVHVFELEIVGHSAAIIGQRHLRARVAYKSDQIVFVNALGDEVALHRTRLCEYQGAASENNCE
jgi:hypothetical protein